MTFRALVGAGAIGAAVAALFGVAPAPAANIANRCTTEGHEAAASAKGAIYIKRTRGSSSGEAESVRIVACSKSSRHPFRVYQCAAESCALIPVAFNGCYAAIGANESSRDATDARTKLIRVNVCTRKSRTVFFEAAREGSNGVASSNVLTAVLKNNGSLAWTTYTQAIENDVVQPPTVNVVKLDSSGKRLLDSSPNIDGKSLALGGSDLYWLNGDTPMHADLH